MKIIFLFTLISFLGMSPSPKNQLTIEFKGMSSDKGQVLVKIVNEKDEKFSGHKIKVKDKKAILVVEVPQGSYAVSAFHDANSDDKLNTNAVGLPIEKYGFSNDARGWFGPPDLEDQLVEINRSTKIKITLK